MRKPSRLGTQETRRSVSSCLASTNFRILLVHSNVVKDLRRRFLVPRFLFIVALCLSALFVAFIVLEAFDGDLDLWPFGTENFTLAAADPLVSGGQLIGVLGALTPILWFVMAAGSYLVLRHRARGALPTDSPSYSPSFNVAEPRWQNPTDALGLGHFFSGAIIRSVASSTGGLR